MFCISKIIFTLLCFVPVKKILIRYVSFFYMDVKVGVSHHENMKDTVNKIMNGISVYKKEKVT